MELPKRPNFSEYEPQIYQRWETEGYFTPQIDPQIEPYTILLPPPNANNPMHAGHTMYVIEDILCRYHRMLGHPTLFLPGTDHAGIETQYVFEKKLSQQGKSRLDYDRETLYSIINQYVEENRGIAKAQLKRLGFSLDWTREKYTLDPPILDLVFDTFHQLHQDNLIYRDERLVNYCVHCGTGYSNLEINHVEREDKLYYLDYGTAQIATTRPETIFADVALAVNPDDPKNKDLIGQVAVIPIINKKIPIIGDEAVDPGFGTGVLKITPGHDQTDYEIGERHQLERISVINREGQMVNLPKELLGLTIKEARQQTVKKLQALKLLIKTEKLTHTVSICYRCKHAIEPILLPQWYIKIKPLVDPVITAVNRNEVKLFPPRFKKELLRWLKTAPDWNISRQIVWGPRIPAWYCLDCSPQIELIFLTKNKKTVVGKVGELFQKYSFNNIQKGLQELIAPVSTQYQLDPDRCHQCGGDHLLQETDTFDTWFSSGQWPITTLGFTQRGSRSKIKNMPRGEALRGQKSKLSDFEYFYPTSVLDTMWDILPFWVMRMLMLGIYRTGEVPFRWVHLHSRVVDSKGKKMSKSLGNVINPMDVVEKYGADALRLALILGTAPASDIPLGEEKLVGARNFTTKLWNISRFILGQSDKFKAQSHALDRDEVFDSGSKFKTITKNSKPNSDDRWIIEELNTTIRVVTNSLEQFRFSQAAEELHEFVWHKLADRYVETTKKRNDKASLLVLVTVLRESLKLLHPFIPFVTEEIYQTLPNKDAGAIMISRWPRTITKTNTVSL